MLNRFLFIILLLIGAKGAQADCATGTVAVPVIVSVSVDVNGDIVICWEPVLDPNLAGYNIWTIDNTGANQQISLPNSLGPLATCFTFLADSNTSGSQCVQILVEAFDNCPLPGPFSSGIFAGGFVCSMYLEAELDPCTSSIDLEWNTNDVFSNPIYEVFVYTNGGPPISQGTTLNTTFSYLGVMLDDSVNFYIVATDNGGLGPATSTSNIDTPNVDGILIKPTFNYLNYATVVDSQQIDLQFTIDTIADMTAYNIQRATSQNGPYAIVGTVDKFLGMDTIVQYSDTNNVKSDSMAYYYRIEIVNDTCGFDGYYSNLASSILVNVTSNNMEAFNTVTFTEYIDWDLGVSHYDLYRAVGGVWELSPLQTFQPFRDSTTFVDDISEVFDGNGEFCYKVIAVSKDALQTESVSNEGCALHEPLLFVPNAFAPRGFYNKVFKPTLTFANPNAYTFKIFNRWGKIIFETGDVSEAWNGRIGNSGDISPVGVYYYVIEFESAAGDSFSKKGVVTIVS